jgi:hypothetical protein
MAYLGQDTELNAESQFETQQLEAAFQQFTNGDVLGAASTLGPVGMVQAGLISTGAGAVLAAAIGVGLALTKLIGRGRTEADIIVPVQNQLINPQGTGQLDQITQMLVRNPNVQGLSALYDQVQRIGGAFMEFIEDPAFNDGRASEQAANTIFPYINGTSGYHWPPPMKPTQGDCVRWGDGTPGGVGTDGMLGAIARAILRQGGTVPPPLLTQGYGSTVPSLQYASSQNYPYIVQSGTIPANAPLSPLRARSVPVIAAGLDLPTLALLGGAVFLLSRKRS